METIDTNAHPNQATGIIQQGAFVSIAIAVILFLVFFHLDQYPLTWFDEGSHLHVPKTLIKHGIYADYSSEGLRYYGPTIGVGPTVMLPIAAIFRLFGIGLLQARLAMALYLLATIVVFFGLVSTLGGPRLAGVATVLLVSSRGVLLLEQGRQVLGEVPGFFFLVAGLWLWFATWEKANWWRLAAVGLLLGLAMVTKYQYLLFIAPTLILVWLINLVYYRQTPQKVFLIPGVVAAFCVVVWQMYQILYLGPATMAENLRIMRESAAGVAFVFSPKLMELNLRELLSRQVFIGALLPALVYGVSLAVPRNRKGVRWGVLLILAGVNLSWYVLASVGWKRYYFFGLALSSIFVARFFFDLTGGFSLPLTKVWYAVRQHQPIVQKDAVSLTMLAWLVVIILMPLMINLQQIISPPFNTPQAMADYMNANVPLHDLIETWEPEMGFLTEHNYHYPPTQLLTQSNNHVWLGGPPTSLYYDFVQVEKPDYILVGHTGRMAEIYPMDLLTECYTLVTSIGDYELYESKK